MARWKAEGSGGIGRVVHEELARTGDRLRLAVVADTHGTPHPSLAQRLDELGPDRILHAGDIGGTQVIRALEAHAPVIAVRGNIDDRVLPDVASIAIVGEGRVLLRVLLTHIGLSGVRLRADVARLARAEGATLVVCGHSHIPFLGEHLDSAARPKGSDAAGPSRTTTVFNPGSAGPRRFHLPIVFGVMDLEGDAVSYRHVSCETGRTWTPRDAPEA
jgi:putative phosphoesterase